MANLGSIKRPIYTGTALAGRALGVGRLRGLPAKPGSLRILMYHKVTDAVPNTIAVGRDSFRAQQRYLAENYAVVSLEQVREHFASDRRLPAKAVLLTFDDGYENNLSAAYPILKDFGHSAVIFPALDFMGGGILPHDRHLATENVTLGWDDLKSMLDVFDVGSHACSHRTLTSLSPAEATEELRRSKETLESRLGQPIIAFSYPKGSIGDFNQETDRAVRDAGYELVFTTLPGTNLPPMDPFHLRRHNVEDFGLRFFKSLLDGSGDLLALKDTRLGYAAKARLRKTLRAERG